MKVNELRKQISEMSVAELEQKLAEYKAELFNLRFQMAMGQLENPMRDRKSVV